MHPGNRKEVNPANARPYGGEQRSNPVRKGPADPCPPLSLWVGVPRLWQPANPLAVPLVDGPGLPSAGRLQGLPAPLGRASTSQVLSLDLRSQGGGCRRATEGFCVAEREAGVLRT